MAAKPQDEWTSGLCDCFTDLSSCCYGFWCCPCFACTVSGNFGENACLPLCDIFSPAALSLFGFPMFVPPASMAIRSAMRNRYGIKGSICKDIAVSCFCVSCSFCQMHREMKNRQKAPEVVNLQPQTVINVQTQVQTGPSK